MTDIQREWKLLRAMAPWAESIKPSMVGLTWQVYHTGGQFSVPVGEPSSLPDRCILRINYAREQGGRVQLDDAAEAGLPFDLEDWHA